MKRLYLLILSACVMLFVYGEEEKVLTETEVVYRDIALRGLLGVHSISGTIEIPPDAAYMHVTYLKFLEGKYLGTGSMVTTSASALEGKVIPIELLIRRSDTNERAGVLSFLGRRSFSSDPHLKQNFSDITSGINELHEGYNILGFASSYESADGYDLDGVGFGDLGNSIKKKKQVIAIGVKFSETKEEADRVLPETYEANPEPASAGQPM